MPHYLTTTDHCLFVWHNNQQTSNNFAVIRAVQKNRTTPGVPCNWNPQDEAGRGAKEKILASRNRMGLFISLFTFTNCVTLLISKEVFNLLTMKVQLFIILTTITQHSLKVTHQWRRRRGDIFYHEFIARENITV